MEGKKIVFFIWDGDWMRHHVLIFFWRGGGGLAWVAGGGKQLSSTVFQQKINYHVWMIGVHRQRMHAYQKA